MANSKAHLVAEEWGRQTWLPAQFEVKFFKSRLRLRSGGEFEFDAVSEGGEIAVCVSANAGRISNGKKARPKLHKIRSDALFLLLASVDQRLIVFTDESMYQLCDSEAKAGRFPTEVATRLAELPTQLEQALAESRSAAAREVSPLKS
jgi:hypothetical protein